MSDAINNQVLAILNASSVVFSACFLHTVKNPFGTGHQSDLWACALAKDGVTEEFDFYMGLGLRKPVLWKSGAPGYDGGPPPRRGSLLYAKWMATASPVPPTPSDLLSSLLVDLDACYTSFQNWCGDFGYDEDSRKALNTYEACQKNGSKLSRIFNPEQIIALREALQDY